MLSLGSTLERELAARTTFCKWNIVFRPKRRNSMFFAHQTLELKRTSILQFRRTQGLGAMNKE